MSGLEALGRVVPSVLLLVVVLLAVRWWAKRGGGSGRTTPVRVLARTGITKGAMLAVVAVEGRRLLVGASEQGVNLLLQLGPDTGVDGGTDGAINGDTDVLPEQWSSDDLSQTMLGDDQTRPGIGLVDRLRQMTVRQPAAARPIRPFRVPRS